MIDPEVVRWLQAFGVTTLVEAPLVAFLLRGDEPSRARRVALAAFASLLTHPLVAFGFPRLGVSATLALVLAETWAVGVEAVFYGVAVRALGAWRALAVSAIANAASFGAGLLLR